MNYQESKEIIARINGAQKILLSCHHHPDSDTVGSALALAQVLKGMGKTVKIICPDHLPKFLSFMPGSESVEYQKFEEFAFNEWDLYIVCDTSNWSRLFIELDFSPPTIPIIVIDNHSSNKGFGEINLLDYETSSVCEMLFKVFQDWNITVDTNMATLLLAGIMGDTGSFQFEVYKNTFDVADELTRLGADINTINFNLFKNLPLELIQFWGVVISKLQIDPAGFAYVAIPFDEYKDYVHIFGTRETAATQILAKIEGTKFCFILTEEQLGNTSVSFRSRSEVDTAKIAMQLGGGGHPAASSAWLREMSFDQALEKTLAACRNV